MNVWKGRRGREKKERKGRRGREERRKRGKRTEWKQGWEKTRGRVEERSRGTQESGISELEEELKKQTGTWGIVSETGEGTLVF